jgi:uncharacterized PurR-regulated membrane protein YhhQ (DUF165 family)
MMMKIKQEIQELKILLRSVPAGVMTLFALSVIMMNLLANKSIDLPVDWLALDCGIIVSWISFLSMDVITKHFGAKAATELSLIAVFFNLLACLIFYIAGHIPGMWGEAYAGGSEALINGALDHTIAGTWYVLLGSTAAFMVSAVVNNGVNAVIGRLLRNRENGFSAYALRSYISTALGQFTDNLVFALLVSHFFFDWSLLQCITCSVTGMVAELFCEVVFSPAGFVICKRWRKDQVGESYLALRKRKGEGAA